MGTVYQAKCPSCGYHVSLNLGGGLLSINLKKNIQVLSNEEMESVLRLMENDEIKSFQIENKIVECKTCRTIECKTIIDITDKQNRKYRFGDTCSSCAKKCNIYDNTKDYHVQCPQCHKSLLDFKKVGLWD